MSVAEKFKQLEKCFDIDVCAEDHHFGGIYSKRMKLPAGYFAISHKHNYDHMSILAEGECLVVTDNGQNKYVAPAIVDIPAGLHHEIVATTDIVWYCLHSVSESDDIDEVLIDRST